MNPSAVAGDWHRYNLKRKVANLDTVPAEEFEKRKQAHEAQAKVGYKEIKRLISNR